MAIDPLLELRGIGKVFDNGTVGLADIDLVAGRGEFLSLLGPSGCGKTTTLRVMAGFEAPTSGKVLLDGRDITALAPHDRPVNTVFQDYALFPHLSVAENVGFGLSIRRMAKTEMRRRVAEALSLVGLGDRGEDRVQALSGGQRQRVALARAVVCEPSVILLDEPLSALDANLREQMQVELKRLQSRLGMTFVMVTHDQTEALAISDRIVVMNHGRIEQIAPPAELYDAPASTFVAGFIGTMNLLPARRQGAAGLVGDSLEVPLASEGGNGAVTVGIRPEDMRVFDQPAPGRAQATVQSIVFHGRSLRMRAALADGTDLAIDVNRQSKAPPPEIGTKVFLGLAEGANCPAFTR